ncbi:hypothetical protein SLS58_002133 [Diplodia intermedia]|uniref:Uncharacterized protein n=1 Tax=Diplodia intermedia TaxID=856260 RepID=A0ABR3U0J7_9PEZI
MFLRSLGLVAGLLLPSASAGVFGRGRRPVVHRHDPDCVVEYDVAATIYEQPVAISTHLDQATIITVGPGATLVVGPDRIPTDIDTVVTVISTHYETSTHTYTINRSGSGVTRTTVRTITYGRPTQTTTTLPSSTFASIPTDTSSTRPYPPPITTSAGESTSLPTNGPPPAAILTRPYLGSVTTTLTITSGTNTVTVALVPATVAAFDGPTATDIYTAGWDGSTSTFFTVLPTQFAATTAPAFSSGPGLAPSINTRLAGAPNDDEATLVLATPTTTFPSTGSTTSTSSTSTESSLTGPYGMTSTWAYFAGDYTTTVVLPYGPGGMPVTFVIYPATDAVFTASMASTTYTIGYDGPTPTAITLLRPGDPQVAYVVEETPTGLETTNLPSVTSSETTSFPSVTSAETTSTETSSISSISNGPNPNAVGTAPYVGDSTVATITATNSGTLTTIVIFPVATPSDFPGLGRDVFTVGYDGFTTRTLTILPTATSGLGTLVIETPTAFTGGPSASETGSSSLESTLTASNTTSFSVPASITEPPSSTSADPNAIITQYCIGCSTTQTLIATINGRIRTLLVMPLPTESASLFTNGVGPDTLTVGYDGSTTRTVTLAPTMEGEQGTVVVETPFPNTASTTESSAGGITRGYVGTGVSGSLYVTPAISGSTASQGVFLTPAATEFTGPVDPSMTLTAPWTGGSTATITIVPEGTESFGEVAILTPVFGSTTQTASPPTESISQTAVPGSQTSEPPSQTSEPPSQTSEPPSQTSEPPSQTSEPPSQTSEPPSQITEPPSQTTETSNTETSNTETSNTETSNTETSNTESSTTEVGPPSTSTVRTQGYIGGNALETITPTINGTPTPVYITPVQTDFTGPYATYTPTIGYDGPIVNTLTLLPVADETSGTIVVESPTAFPSDTTSSSAPSITGVPSPTDNAVPYVSGTSTTFVSATLNGATFTFTLTPTTTPYDGPTNLSNTYTIGGPTATVYTIVPTGTQTEGTIIIQTATESSPSTDNTLTVSGTSTVETTSSAGIPTTSSSTTVETNLAYLTGTSVLLVSTTISGSQALLTLTPATVSTFNGYINTETPITIPYGGSQRTTLTVFPTDLSDPFATGSLVVETPTFLSTVVTGANTRIVPYYTGTDILTLVYSSGSLVNFDQGSTTTATGSGPVVPTRLASALAGTAASSSNVYTTYYLTPGTETGYTGPVGGQTTFTLSCQGTTTTQYTIPPTDMASPTGTFVTASPCTYTTATVTTTIGYSDSTTSTYTITPNGPASTGDQTVTVIVEEPFTDDDDNSTTEPTMESTTEPTMESTTEATTESTAEATTESTAEATTEATTEPTTSSEFSMTTETATTQTVSTDISSITAAPESSPMVRPYLGDSTTDTVTASSGLGADPTVFPLTPYNGPEFTGNVDPSVTYTAPYAGTATRTLVLLPVESATDATMLVETPTFTPSDTASPSITASPTTLGGIPRRLYVGDSTTGTVTAYPNGATDYPTTIELDPYTGGGSFTGPFDPSTTLIAPYDGTDVKTLSLLPDATGTYGTYLVEVPRSALASSTSAPTATDSTALSGRQYQGDTTTGTVTATPFINGNAVGGGTTISLDPATSSFSGPIDPVTTFSAFYPGSIVVFLTLQPTSGGTVGTLLVEVPSTSAAPSTTSSASAPSGRLYDGDTTTASLTATPVTTLANGEVATLDPTVISIDPATAAFYGSVDPSITLTATYPGSDTVTLLLHPTGTDTLGTVFVEVPATEFQSSYTQPPTTTEGPSTTTNSATITTAPSGGIRIARPYQGGTTPEVVTVTPTTTGTDGVVTTGEPTTFSLDPATTSFTGGFVSTTLTGTYPGTTTETVTILPGGDDTLATPLVNVPASAAAIPTVSSSEPASTSASVSSSPRLYQGGSAPSTLAITPVVTGPDGVTTGDPTEVSLDLATSSFTGPIDTATTYTATYAGSVTQIVTLQPLPGSSLGNLLVEVPETANASFSLGSTTTTGTGSSTSTLPSTTDVSSVPTETSLPSSSASVPVNTLAPSNSSITSVLPTPESVSSASVSGTDTLVPSNSSAASVLPSDTLAPSNSSVTAVLPTTESSPSASVSATDTLSSPSNSSSMSFPTTTVTSGDVTTTATTVVTATDAAGNATGSPFTAVVLWNQCSSLLARDQLNHTDGYCPSQYYRIDD